MKRLTCVLVLSFVLGSCSSPESPKLIPRAVVQKAVAEEDTSVRSGKVDILFVVDNSGSMSSYQANLSANIGRFINVFFNGASVDYQIGVVSTDADKWATKNCCGRLLGTPAVIDTVTPDGNLNLSKRLEVGTDGSATERAFDPVTLALSEPLVSTVNSGFLRKDAYLAIIFITDAEDQSDISPEDFYQFLLTLKGVPERILAYGAIIPTGYEDPSNCGRDSGEPLKIERFLAMTANTGKNIFNLCSSDFGDRLAGVAKDVVEHVAGMVYLKYPPIVESIKVSYGSQIVPMDHEYGWSFDAGLNAVYIGKKFVLDPLQPNGTKIMVDYDHTTYDESLQAKK
ncbi:MAG: VWA domain-containing protein [Bdellovibrionaceae bacterium]|nr:VWA domain-containing protein [Pseudobdellovibrionaceae bacterium]